MRSLSIGTVWMVAAALVAGLAATSVSAATLEPTDLDEIELGEMVYGPETHDWLTAVHGSDVGDLTARVFENEGVFTYTYEVDQNPLWWEVINSPGGLLALNQVAGYSFSEAADAGEPAFTIRFNEEASQFKWQVAGTEERLSAWDPDQPITFFYQSTFEPGPLGAFGSTWSSPTRTQAAAEALGVVPIPEPASASLLGLLGLAMLRRRRRAKA